MLSFLKCINIKMSSKHATNLTVTLSPSVEDISNCVTQLISNSIGNSIEIYVIVTILVKKKKRYFYLLWSIAVASIK